VNQYEKDTDDDDDGLMGKIAQEDVTEGKLGTEKRVVLYDTTTSTRMN